jgi:hypothetical protein
VTDAPSGNSPSSSTRPPTTLPAAMRMNAFYQHQTGVHDIRY